MGAESPEVKIEKESTSLALVNLRNLPLTRNHFFPLPPPFSHFLLLRQYRHVYLSFHE